MLIKNKLSTEDIIKAVRGILVNGDMGITFKGICTDTRIFEPGFLFWALKGKNFDGHNFWKEALEKGAKGLVLEYLPKEMKLEELPKTISIILVKDTLKALGDLAKWFREKENFNVIAITGSCGKTTTKEFTYAILSSFYKVAKNKGNYNNLIGVPLSILGFTDKPNWAVLELGTNAPGEIERLGEICSPNISLITSIYPAHLEGLKSTMGILKEKISLFKKTSKDGKLIYFYDQPLLREEVKNFPQEKISFGKDNGADLRLLKAERAKNKLRVQLAYLGKSYDLEVDDLGEHNLYNLLGAIAVSLATGLAIDAVIEKIPKNLSALIRSKIYKKEKVYLIDDTYNANPGSMEKALLWLKEQVFNYNYKTVILGDMKELGDEAREYHKKIGELVALIADKAIFIGEMAPYYAEGFKDSGKPYEIYGTVEDFIEKGPIEDIIGIVLIKGSRALRMERIVEKILKEVS